MNRTDSVSGSLTHVFSPTLTNEVVFGYTYIDFPNQYAGPKAVDKQALGINLQGLYKNGYPFVPNVNIGGTTNTSAQPFITCDPRASLGENQFMNLNCFAPPTPGRNRNYIFPYMKGPGFL